MEDTLLKKRLKHMVEPDKNPETRFEDVAWLCSLSESEIDMLVSLKLLIIQRAKMIGCKELANKFNLKMIRAIALVLMEHLKAEIKESLLIPAKAKSTSFLDACNLLKCSNGVAANVDELNSSLGVDILTFLIRRSRAAQRGLSLSARNTINNIEMASLHCVSNPISYPSPLASLRAPRSFFFNSPPLRIPSGARKRPGSAVAARAGASTSSILFAIALPSSLLAGTILAALRMGAKLDRDWLEEMARNQALMELEEYEDDEDEEDIEIDDNDNKEEDSMETNVQEKAGLKEEPALAQVRNRPKREA